MIENVLKDEKATGDKAAAAFVRLAYVCYFQELFVFQLRFVSWRGYGLRAADAPKKKAKQKDAEDKEAAKAARRKALEEKRQAKLQAAKEKRDRRRQATIDAQRAAVSGGSKGLKELRGDTGNTGAPADETGGGGVELATSGAPGTSGGEGDTTSLLAGGDEKGGKMKMRKKFSLGRRKSKEGAGGAAAAGGAPDAGSPKGGRFKRKKLSFAERVEVQNQKDEAKKKKKMEGEMKRLRKLKEAQDKREDKRLKKAEALRKKEEYDPEIYEEASSDPYIVFSIDPPTNPGCKVLRHGGYFGRTVRTDMVTNTLNPSFEEARKPLAYLGTRSELENEILRVRVYDWDFFSADDLIGQADVPLNGLLEYGQVEVELTLDLPDATQKKVRGKHPKKTVPAGRLSGQILFEGRLPAYNQLGGGLVERKQGVTYLAIRLESASKLLAADPNNSSDPFVTVDWDGMQQTSKVINRSLEPVWKQTLYFPLKLVTLNKQALANKPPVSIRVFDLDEAGHDLLGSCEIPLHRITSAEHAKIDDELGSDGRVHKGRVLRLPAQPLILPGHKIQSTINLSLYFAPDLPTEIMLEEQAQQLSQALSDEYMARLKTFYAQIPGRVRTQLEQAMLAEFARGADYELGWEQQKRLVSAEDQDAVEHFFSEYLSPQQPPSDMQTPMQVARMVRCITWAVDTEIFKKDSRRDVWQSPTFFLEMRKGDAEDHALLMCNLFLGLGLDAYVCIGRLNDQSDGDKRWVWCMTRDPNGDIGMWETSMGTCVTLLERWQGVQLSAAERAVHAAATAKIEKGQKKGLLGGILSKKSKKGKEGEGLLSGEGGAEGADALIPLEEDSGDPNSMDALMDLDKSGGRDAHLLSTAEEMMLEHAPDDLLTKHQVEESLNEVFWNGDGGMEEGEEGGGGASSSAAASAEAKAEKEQLDALRRAAGAEMEMSEEVCAA